MSLNSMWKVGVTDRCKILGRTEDHGEILFFTFSLYLYATSNMIQICQLNIKRFRHWRGAFFEHFLVSRPLLRILSRIINKFLNCRHLELFRRSDGDRTRWGTFLFAKHIIKVMGENRHDLRGSSSVRSHRSSRLCVSCAFPSWVKTI